MANRPEPPIRDFRSGSPPPTARELQIIVDMLIRQLVGGKGINVRSFGNRIVIEEDDL